MLAKLIKWILSDLIGMHLHDWEPWREDAIIYQIRRCRTCGRIQVDSQR